MKKRTRRGFILALILSILPLSPVFAQTEPRVFDHAGLLTEQEILNLEQHVHTFIEEYRMDAVMVTTLNANGKGARAYADDYYDENNFGFGEDYDGILFLIDMDNREIYISTAGRMIEILTDNRIDLILDGQFDRVAEGDYYDAFLYGLQTAASYIKSGPVPGQYSIDENETGTIPRKRITPEGILLSVFVGMAVGGIAVLAVYLYYRKDYHKAGYDYRTNSRLNLTKSDDILVNTFVSTRRIPTHTGSGSSGSFGSSAGRSTTHRSSSGRTHGGGGRKF